MPQVPWPSFTLVLTAERPQDIYRPAYVIRLIPAVMEPTAPAYLMKTIDYRWEATPSNFAQEFTSDNVFAYTLRNDSNTPTYVDQSNDADDDAKTVLEERQPTGRRGLTIRRKLSSMSLRPSRPNFWNKTSFFRLMKKISALDVRPSRLRAH